MKLKVAVVSLQIGFIKTACYCSFPNTKGKSLGYYNPDMTSNEMN